jgi:hypothetical protein
MARSSNSAPPVKSARSCVLYDSDSGQILHIHQAVVLEGGETPTEAELESTARAMLERRDAEPSKVVALHLAHTDFKPRTAYSVDVATKALVEHALPPRRPPGFKR